MKRLYLVLILGLCLLLSASVAQAQPAWQAAAQKALGQAQTELGQPAKTSDLLTLTNAAYCQVDGQSCEGFISMVQQSLGCGTWHAQPASGAFLTDRHLLVRSLPQGIMGKWFFPNGPAKGYRPADH